MAKKEYSLNVKANESISKYKLLSAYGAPGSIIHTQYGSIITSSIEEWGFLKKVLELDKRATERGKNEEERITYVLEEARDGNIGISNDNRLLKALQNRIGLINLKYLVLIPDIALTVHNNQVKNDVQSTMYAIDLTIPSSFMPKVFANRQNLYKAYKDWFRSWVSNKSVDDRYGNRFFPPKYITNEEKGWYDNLVQDNIVLICSHGHISDFPWPQFLRWRKEEPVEIFGDNPIDLFNRQACCHNPMISIKSSSANASGFDGKWLKCTNCKRGVSLKGLLGVKIKCPGHKPWEAKTKYDGNGQYDFPYSGNEHARNHNPPSEVCKANNPMTVALTTGNNLYYTRVISSIYMHDELFENDITLEIKKLTFEKEAAIKNENFELAIVIQNKIKVLAPDEEAPEDSEMNDSEKELKYRFQEFTALNNKDEKLLSKEEKHLRVRDVTENLHPDLKLFFHRVQRIDNMKITSAQLDFSRVFPSDSDSEAIISKNIFSSKNDEVLVYPVVENFGEGIFISFDDERLNNFASNSKLIIEIKDKIDSLKLNANSFNRGAINKASILNWQLYLVHTFSHLIMRELEFRCGYPTASLFERIYVSNDEKYKMYGCMIYTTEGAEGSMGGLIAQTRPHNLNKLIKSAINRATVCNSDPLCWESEGQGLFDLNFASCFSCGLVSETSCEHGNLYLDRKILVDMDHGFFKEILV